MKCARVDGGALCMCGCSLSLSLFPFLSPESRGLWERKRERGQTRRHLCQLSRQREIVTWAIRRSSASPLFSSSLRHLLFLHLSMCKRSSTARRPTHTTHAAASPCNTRIPPASWGRKHARGALTLLLARVLQLHWRRWADAMRGNDCPRWRASRRLGARKTHAGGAQRGGGAGSMCACLLSPRYSTLASTTYCWCTALGSPLFSLSLSIVATSRCTRRTRRAHCTDDGQLPVCLPASGALSSVRAHAHLSLPARYNIGTLVLCYIVYVVGVYCMYIIYVGGSVQYTSGVVSMGFRTLRRVPEGEISRAERAGGRHGLYLQHRIRACGMDGKFVIARVLVYARYDFERGCVLLKEDWIKYIGVYTYI